jgi:hypothetical protein
MERISVPFSRTTIDWSGLGAHRTVAGLLHLDETGLVFEFREKVVEWDDHKLRLVETRPDKVRTVRIPLDELESIDARGWLFRRRLVVRTNSLAALQEIPHVEGATVALSVPFGMRDRARELSTSATLRLAEQALQRLEAGEWTRLAGGESRAAR